MAEESLKITVTLLGSILLSDNKIKETLLLQRDPGFRTQYSRTTFSPTTLSYIKYLQCALIQAGFSSASLKGTGPF